MSIFPRAMPREIRVYQIGRTRVNRAAVRKWVRSLGAKTFKLPEPDTVSDGALLVALAGKRCYNSFEPGLNPNVTKVREDYVSYLDNILSSGHGSVLEHVVYNYAIENLTRVCTAELNRHRAGMAISEGSLRYYRFGEIIPFWMPDSIKEKPGDNEDLILRKQQSRQLFLKAFRQDGRNYAEFMRIWEMDEKHHNFKYKKTITSIARRIIGMGVSTGGVWSGNVRALRHVFTMRCSPHAEEEICKVFGMILVDIAKQEPSLFGDFKQDEDGFWKPTYVKV